MSLSLVAGLGNPGRDYQETRHNLGWILLDAFAREKGLVWQVQSQLEAEIAKWSRPGQPACILLKPLTYMNDSGRALAAAARYFKVAPTDIAVVYDEYTIELGRLKVSIGGSAGGHNGVASVLQHLGDGFVRYRLGIGPKQPAQIDLKDFVLGKFTPSQQSLVTQSLPHFLQGLDLLVTHGAEKAMNTLNRKDPNETDQP